MTDLHFAAPEWVHLLWIILILAALLVWLERRGSGALDRFVRGRGRDLGFREDRATGLRHPDLEGRAPRVDPGYQGLAHRWRSLRDAACTEFYRLQ